MINFVVIELRFCSIYCLFGKFGGVLVGEFINDYVVLRVIFVSVDFMFNFCFGGDVEKVCEGRCWFVCVCSCELWYWECFNLGSFDVKRCEIVYVMCCVEIDFDCESCCYWI